jgi:hypothetical protein
MQMAELHYGQQYSVKLDGESKCVVLTLTRKYLVEIEGEPGEPPMPMCEAEDESGNRYEGLIPSQFVEPA